MPLWDYNCKEQFSFECSQNFKAFPDDDINTTKDMLYYVVILFFSFGVQFI